MKGLCSGDLVVEIGRLVVMMGGESTEIGAEQPCYSLTSRADAYPLAEYVELIAERQCVTARCVTARRRAPRPNTCMQTPQDEDCP